MFGSLISSNPAGRLLASTSAAMSPASPSLRMTSSSTTGVPTIVVPKSSVPPSGISFPSPSNTVISGIENPYLLLIAVYLMTMLMTETITNNAVAALMFPIATNIAIQGGYDPRPFVIAIALAANLSFVTPIGYQTNLMVMGPGGYRPVDFLRCGIPLAIAVGITALFLIPRVWPF